VPQPHPRAQPRAECVCPGPCLGVAIVGCKHALLLRVRGLFLTGLFLA
jgi:hypothetical protein